MLTNPLFLSYADNSCLPPGIVYQGASGSIRSPVELTSIGVSFLPFRMFLRCTKAASLTLHGTTLNVTKAANINTSVGRFPFQTSRVDHLGWNVHLSDGSNLIFWFR